MPWNFQPDRPIYAQLIDRLRRAIAAGEYSPGSRLPTVRELAAQAGINPNTVQRAYLELERDGLIYSQRTTGRFVTEDEGLVDAARKTLAAEQVQTFLWAMAALGFSKDEARAMLAEEEKEEL